GRGNDILTGGAGADVFEFERGDGRDIVTDFQNGVDRLDFDDFSRAQVQAVISNAQQVGDDLVLRLSADTIVTIENMQKAQLDMGDFTF
ncbi:calcium-binding protein, partial [Paracoccus sp. PXZ]